MGRFVSNLFGDKVMSKDDIDTNTMNVMFDGSDEADDKDDEKLERMVKYFEDDYNMRDKNRRHTERERVQWLYLQFGKSNRD